MNPMRKGINLLADAHFIPIRDKSISKTLCKSVLEHVKNPFKVVLEMKRITAYKIIIVVPNIMNIKRIIQTLRNPMQKVNFDTRHLQGWDSKVMKHFAILTGLKVESIEWWFEKPERLGFICPPLFSSHMIAVLKDKGEICKKCGTPKKCFWCDPDFSYCPNCDIDGQKCPGARDKTD